MVMEVINISDLNEEKQLKKVVTVLEKGGLIVYPTETVYGLGVDATNENGLNKLWEFKGERGNKPVLVAVSGNKMAGELVDLNDLGKKVIQKYWPGSVAIVSKSLGKVSKKAQGETETLGLRMIGNERIQNIVEILGKPLTSTSANISGGKTINSFAEFEESIPEDRQKLIDIFIDGGELANSLPSTIVDVTGEEVLVLRQGKIDVEVS